METKAFPHWTTGHRSFGRHPFSPVEPNSLNQHNHTQYPPASNSDSYSLSTYRGLPGAEHRNAAAAPVLQTGSPLVEEQRDKHGMASEEPRSRGGRLPTIQTNKTKQNKAKQNGAPAKKCVSLKAKRTNCICCPKEEECMLNLIYILHMLFFLWMAEMCRAAATKFCTKCYQTGIWSL